MAGGAAVGTSAGTQAIQELIHPGKWYKNSRLVKLNLWILLLLITSSTNGYDGSMMNGLQTLDQWKSAFNYPKGSMLGLLNAIQNIGSILATPIAPYITDHWGRRSSILIGAAIMIVGTIVQTTSQNVGSFIAARFCVGLGVSIAQNAAPLLVTELAYPSQRAPLTSTYNALWYSGAIVAAWTTYGSFRMNGTWSWRLPSVLQGLPSVIQLSLILFCPESPRWLVSQGREEEAVNTIAYYHARGNVQDPLVQYEFNEIKEALRLEAEAAASVSYLDLFRTPGNRKRMRIIIALAFFSQWSGNGLVSYYLNKVFDTIGITNVAIQNLINGILQIYNLIMAVGAGLLCDRVGRRKLFLISNAGMLIFFTMQTVCSARYAIAGSNAAANAVIAAIFLFYGSYDLAYTPLIVSYTVEILPFRLRAKGFTVFNFSISLSLIFNQYVNPVALDAIGWKYYIVYCVWLVFEFIYAYLFIVETKGHTLEETAALFDGEDAVRELHGRTVADLQHDAKGATKTPSLDEKGSTEHVEKN
ncbi:hypothetical protein FRC03_006385 [Tulasnella sp. 419]|nr:hypothetical protein FRC02_005336 [Tulasnella sp. 418]KAG8960564.1 hypothetical protein FRC03_006385 [Tulasnella sp. 419]